MPLNEAAQNPKPRFNFPVILGLQLSSLADHLSSVQMALEFNLDEDFPYLSKAPIVEAVLQINTRATADWTEQRVSTELSKEFGDGIQMQSIQTSEAKFQASPMVGIEKADFHSSWTGFRIPLAEKPEIISFTRDFFSYSRLQPYERWSRFLERAIALLRTHIRIAKPGDAQRIGLRFVNRIEMTSSLNLEDYFVDPPKDLTGFELPLSSFVYQAIFQVPSHPYSIRVSRTLEQTATPLKNPPALLLDLDVFTFETISMNPQLIEEHLRRMRWLKNKVFFGTITTKLKEALL
jgi:uncharacterized protein (TIGR04255 family)